MKRLSLAWPVLAGDTAADALVYVTLGWLAVQTGDLSASLVLAANTVPAICLMLLGGAVSDRFGVVRTATWTTTTRAVVLAGFAALVSLGATNAPTLLTVALALGIIDAVHQPSVYGLVGVLAEKGQQRSSQAMVVGVTRTVGVVGSIAGGALIALHVELPLIVASGCLVVAALSATRVPRTLDADDEEVGEDNEPSTIWQMTREGLHAVRRDHVVVAVLLLFTVGNFAATAPLSLGIPFMADRYEWSGAQYGLVYAGFGVGQVLGGLGLVALTRRGIIDEGRLGLGTAAGLLLPAAAFLGLLGSTASPVLAAVAIAGTGLFLAPGASILMGFVRERTPDRFQGRVNGLIGLSITASIPLGMIVFGLLVQLRSVAFAITACAGALGLGALCAAAGAARLSRTSSGQPREQTDRERSGTSPQ